MDELDDIVREFLVESSENLDQLERDLVQLEDTPDDPDLLASVFRTIHTIKGTCGFLGYTKLQGITHVGENLLSKVRDGDLRLSGDVATVLLDMVDAVREILAQIEGTGTEGDTNYTALVARLEALVEDAPADALEISPELLRSPSASNEALSEESVLSSGPESAETVEAVSVGQPPPLPAAPHIQKPAPRSDGGQAPRQGVQAVDSSIRVHVDLLDRLMNLVGELVLARNQIVRLAEELRDPALLATTQRLNQVTSELQEGVMTTRMQPIGTLWTKLPRVVRELARGFCKQVRVEMEGEETGLDKTLIEAIKDPLTHLVRNAVDHGLELPDERMAACKEPEGTLRLRAYHEGGQVNLEISDDGAGIDPVKLIARAVERGLIASERAEKLTKRQALNLLFLPGLSTARKVTNISGRGVGMDVVKNNVERIGGSIDIATEVGEGTTFRLKIPLTLAIVPALFVRAGDQRYAIPQVNLLELVRLEREEALEEIHGAPVFLLRGRLLPILNLGRELGLLDVADTGERGVRHILVLQAEDQRFGLVVDDVQDTEEIVVKPLGEHVKEIGAFAGATIMGDGQVALILDVVGLAQRGGIARRVENSEPPDALGDSLACIDESTSLLIAEGAARVCAVPLERVQRLEEISTERVEFVGDQAVFQYRGGILPLIYLDDADADDIGVEALQVVVFDYRGHSVGVVVRRIVDILSEHIDVRGVGIRPGVAGTAIIGDCVVEVIDLDGLADLRGLQLSGQTALREAG